LIYNAEQEEEVLEDMETLAQGLKLLQYDYLGGHGSRGYGRVRFQGLQADLVVGDLEDELMDKVNEILSAVEADK